MNTSESLSIGRYLNSEDLLRNQLIDKILILSSIIAGAAVAFALLRDIQIGWTYRDATQVCAFSFLVLLTFFRKKLSSRHKAFSLIIVYLLGGIVGVYTLGMLAGTVFIFPLISVVVSLFYSTRTTLTFVSVSILFYSLIAIGFCSGRMQLPSSFELLMTSYSHWVVYIICIGFFFVVGCLTILDYRKAMASLMAQIRQQRDDMIKSSQDLRSALDDIKKLSGLLPICASCKKIRDDQGYWNRIESYIENHSDAEFSHGICPECAKRLYPDLDIDD